MWAALLIGCVMETVGTSEPVEPTQWIGADTAAPPAEPWSMVVFDEVVFFDGYAALVDAPVPDGVVRVRNDLVTRRIDDAELAKISDTLVVDVVIGALCDNYDRIGNVSLALVPKGASSYEPADVERFEVGRFITPFMNKNIEPDEVPYQFDAVHLVSLLTDPSVRTQFDLWLELEVFGVPYAANEEVAGCEGRNDVFRGSVTLSSEPTGEPPPAFDQWDVLAFKASFNDYQPGASDAIGLTRKTLPFSLDAAVADAEVVLILSNHGANAGGEEYERREHIVRVDGDEVLRFTPGRNTCEPFREYNTQANGIYGFSRRSPAEWQSFSNWCPGDVIDTRRIPLGALDAGAHEVQIEVPDAVFVDDQGDFPTSVWVAAQR